ncbi:MAG: tRNA preQ1(34) S-adenosylmethionine ribosyltransferase-isomerase QueA [Candidatus Dormibacteria bacterium]
MAVPGTEAATGLRLADYDYELPADRIAQQPAPRRDGARLLHLTPGGRYADHQVTDLPELLRPGDLLVANHTRVRAARLRGHRDPEGGAVELLVLAALGGDSFACLVRPGRRLRPGARVRLSAEFGAVIGEPSGGHPGARTVRFEAAGGDVVAAIERHGTAPLPPYITEPLRDPERYQTVYAAGEPASAAAPTAGLHFTAELREALVRRGVAWTSVDLEVGLGTFAPIQATDVRDHRMHAERYRLGAATVEAVDRARRRGGRVVAVGTTAVRTLETCASGDGRVAGGAGLTELYLRPGAPVRVVDGLLTNFHQPRSSLLVLLACLVGQETWRRAYAHALASGYRFLSFGDCMLCWTRQ